ncbi:class A beta-lactamase [Actinomadura atramentaria]|uniref:class A beta-lactamase n=1 Tax=Actinomadura atramentaria TaxID=1990 RepID=UPI0003628776|nr:class A beta-lactamase [Actinomadura atramentaria]
MGIGSLRFRLVLSAVVALGGCGGGSPAAERAVPRGAPGDVAASSVERQLRRLEQRHHGRVGAYAIDTGTGRVLGHRSDELFPVLSTSKAMTAAAVLRKARRSDPGLLDRVVRYTRGDLVANSPVTEKHVGTGMTVADLCAAAITVSDNTAGNLLLRQIGGPAGLTAFYRSLGDPVSRLDRWETDLNVWRPGERRDTTAPAAYARDLRTLTLGTALAPADRDRLTGWMKATTTGGARIRAGLPKGWTVADKTGTGPGYGTTNDVAVAWPPSGAPIVLVILTNRRAADGAADEATVAETTAVLARGLGAAG